MKPRELYHEDSVMNCRDPYHTTGSVSSMVYDNCPSCKQGESMSLDDDRNNVGECPVVLVAEERRKVPRVYRVSWNVNGVRKEVFFASKAWAEKHVNKLLECAQIVGIDIDPMIGDIQVSDEPA
jgi:hypothetical protein